jgi:hypothetical protein
VFVAVQSRCPITTLQRIFNLSLRPFNSRKVLTASEDDYEDKDCHANHEHDASDEET